MSNKVTLYTDGACRGNPGPGGWGVLMIFGDKEKRIYGALEHTTNNRMELTAAIEGLRKLKFPCEVTIFTDSKYVMQGIQEWLVRWEKNGWRTSNRKPVKNSDLWQALALETKRHEIEWQWVRGHSGDPGNEVADALANVAIDELLK